MSEERTISGECQDPDCRKVRRELVYFQKQNELLIKQLQDLITNRLTLEPVTPKEGEKLLEADDG